MNENPDSRERDMTRDTYFGREEHLCMFAAAGLISRIAELSKNPSYICRICGRVAQSEKSLCDPKLMD